MAVKVTLLPEAVEQIEKLPSGIREAIYNVLFQVQGESDVDLYVGGVYLGSTATISN